MLADEHGGLALLVNAFRRQGTVTGRSRVLPVMVACKIHIGTAVCRAENLPVGHKVFVVGKAVVHDLGGDQLVGVQLVPQPKVHPVVMQQGIQMGGRLKHRGLAGRRAFRRNILGKAVIPAAGNLAAGGLGSAVQRIQKLLVVAVVRIAKGKPPGVQVQPRAHPGSAGGGNTALALVDHNKPGVPAFPRGGKLGAFIGGTVIHHKTGEIAKGLRSQGCQTLLQKRSAVMYRYHHGNGRAFELGLGFTHGCTSFVYFCVCSR